MMQGNVRDRRRIGRQQKAKTEGNFYQGLDKNEFCWLPESSGEQRRAKMSASLKLVVVPLGSLIEVVRRQH